MIHAAAVAFIGLPILAILILWVVAEQRRAEAEAARAVAEERLEAARARAARVRTAQLRYHAEELRLAGIAADRFDEAVAKSPPVYMEPIFDAAQRGFSAVRVIQKTAQSAIDALEGEDLG